MDVERRLPQFASPTMTMIVVDEDDLSEALVDIDVKDDVLFQ